MKFATKAIHVGQEADPTTGATIVPIYQTSTYTQDAVGEHKGFDYSHTINPTRLALERQLASLESAHFGSAFAKSQTAAYGSLPTEGTVFVSVANRDKRSLVFPVKRLADLGFRVLATAGTAEMLRRNGIPCDEVRKHFEPPGDGRPKLSAVDAIRAGEIDMVIKTPYGNSGPRIDGYEIRSAAVAMNIPCVTTVQGASAAVQGIEAGIRGDIDVMSLQELHSVLGS